MALNDYFTSVQGQLAFVPEAPVDTDSGHMTYVVPLNFVAQKWQEFAASVDFDCPQILAKWNSYSGDEVFFGIYNDYFNSPGFVNVRQPGNDPYTRTLVYIADDGDGRDFLPTGLGVLINGEPSAPLPFSLGVMNLIEYARLGTASEYVDAPFDIFVWDSDTGYYRTQSPDFPAQPVQLNDRALGAFYFRSSGEGTNYLSYFLPTFDYPRLPFNNRGDLYNFLFPTCAAAVPPTDRPPVVFIGPGDDDIYKEWPNLKYPPWNVRIPFQNYGWSVANPMIKPKA